MCQSFLREKSRRLTGAILRESTPDALRVEEDTALHSMGPSRTLAVGIPDTKQRMLFRARCVKRSGIREGSLMKLVRLVERHGMTRFPLVISFQHVLRHSAGEKNQLPYGKLRKMGGETRVQRELHLSQDQRHSGLFTSVADVFADYLWEAMNSVCFERENGMNSYFENVTISTSHTISESESSGRLNESSILSAARTLHVLSIVPNWEYLKGMDHARFNRVVLGSDGVRLRKLMFLHQPHNNGVIYKPPSESGENLQHGKSAGAWLSSEFERGTDAMNVGWTSKYAKSKKRKLLRKEKVARLQFV